MDSQSSVPKAKGSGSKTTRRKSKKGKEKAAEDLPDSSTSNQDDPPPVADNKTSKDPLKCNPGPRQHPDGFLRAPVRGEDRRSFYDPELVAATMNYHGCALFATTHMSCQILHGEFIDPRTGKSVLQSFYEDQVDIEPGSEHDLVTEMHLTPLAVVSSVFSRQVGGFSDFFQALCRHSSHA